MSNSTILKTFLELSSIEFNGEETKQNVSLHRFSIDDHSVLVGQNIRESGIREQSQGLVVGIERNGERILNPESDTTFEVNDKVWIVGNEKLIRDKFGE